MDLRGKSSACYPPIVTTEDHPRRWSSRISFSVAKHITINQHWPWECQECGGSPQVKPSTRPASWHIFSIVNSRLFNLFSRQSPASEYIAPTSISAFCQRWTVHRKCHSSLRVALVEPYGAGYESEDIDPIRGTRATTSAGTKRANHLPLVQQSSEWTGEEEWSISFGRVAHRSTESRRGANGTPGVVTRGVIGLYITAAICSQR